MSMDPMAPPIPEAMPDDGMPEEDQAGGTRDAMIDALLMVTDPEFLSALDDSAKLVIEVDVDTGDVTLTAGDVSTTIPASILRSAEPGE